MYGFMAIDLTSHAKWPAPERVRLKVGSKLSSCKQSNRCRHGDVIFVCRFSNRLIFIFIFIVLHISLYLNHVRENDKAFDRCDFAKEHFNVFIEDYTTSKLICWIYSTYRRKWVFWILTNKPELVWVGRTDI